MQLTQGAEHVARMYDTRNACTVFVWKHFGMRILARLRRKWEYNIGADVTDRLYRLQGSVENARDPISDGV
jgi:hypothetical protein